MLMSKAKQPSTARTTRRAKTSSEAGAGWSAGRTKSGRRWTIGRVTFFAAPVSEYGDGKLQQFVVVSVVAFVCGHLFSFARPLSHHRRVITGLALSGAVRLCSTRCATNVASTPRDLVVLKDVPCFLPASPRRLYLRSSPGGGSGTDQSRKEVCAAMRADEKLI